MHQPLDLGAHAARDELLSRLGFTTVQHSGEKVTASTPESVPGFILAGAIDVHSRCVALAGRGAPPAGTKSGDWITVDVPLLQTTANHHLLSFGLVFPTFYSDLFPDLRTELTTVAQQARAAGLGVWAKDRTTTRATITGLHHVIEVTGKTVRMTRPIEDLVFAEE
ncbi:hypothetical protein OG762_13155 [Streptomyces sp. NBC_01136]|uniref:hypothetical protein n=1 Tax=unclassified Streptomyces TaxID=2593676 RepID=UPI003253DAE9|nr:hypothetical protein OG762_13155 [Streptomyces sp. NBC_01136]